MGAATTPVTLAQSRTNLTQPGITLAYVQSLVKACLIIHIAAFTPM